MTGYRLWLTSGIETIFSKRDRKWKHRVREMQKKNFSFCSNSFHAILSIDAHYSSGHAIHLSILVLTANNLHLIQIFIIGWEWLPGFGRPPKHTHIAVATWSASFSSVCRSNWISMWGAHASDETASRDDCSLSSVRVLLGNLPLDEWSKKKKKLNRQKILNSINVITWSENIM